MAATRALPPVPVVLAACLLALPVAAGALCPGDCDGDNQVVVNELVVGVNIALGATPLAACTAFDGDGDESVDVAELVTAVNAALGGCPAPVPTPIFPADYRASFTEVRDCRFSVEHDNVSIRVLANAAAAPGYLSNGNPLPVGSIVIKEEYDANDCADEGKLLRWSVARKEAAGFDPDDGDWHWQRVLADRSVAVDGKATCIGCHRAPACLARDYMCTVSGGAAVEPVKLVFENQPAALLSVSGTAPDDVYVVGAHPPGDAFGPYVLHYDGKNWQRLNSGASGDLWWVSVTPIGGAFYMAGAGGLILRYEPDGGRFVKQATPGTQTMFGVWGTRPDSIWAVGGDPTNPSQGGVIWHFDGSAWSAQDLSAARPSGVPTLFKVWGRTADDVYAVGQGGVILHYDGAAWRQAVSNSVRPLFTVHGNADRVVATGGFFDGVILELQGDEFVDRAPAGAKQVNGVFVPADGRAVAVGREGEVSRRGAADWAIDSPAVGTPWDFHAVWVDPEGGVWAVGGDLSTDLNRGMLGYGGTRTIGRQIVQPANCPPGTTGGPSSVSFSQDVLPLLQKAGCTSATCHAPPFPSSGYNLTTYFTIFGPGVYAKDLQACDIVPGNPDASFLVEKLMPNPRRGVQMPNGRPPLSQAQIDLVRTWILEGAQNN